MKLLLALFIAIVVFCFIGAICLLVLALDDLYHDFKNYKEDKGIDKLIEFPHWKDKYSTHIKERKRWANFRRKFDDF